MRERFEQTGSMSRVAFLFRSTLVAAAFLVASALVLLHVGPLTAHARSELADSPSAALLSQRDDLSYKLLSVDEDAKLQDRVFELRNVTTGEAHALVTDEHGAFDTALPRGARRVNAADILLADSLQDAAALEDAAVWFYDEAGDLQTRDGTRTDGASRMRSTARDYPNRSPRTDGGGDVQRSYPQQGLGALPFGLYELRELKSAANSTGPFQRDEFVVAGKAQSTQLRETAVLDASAPVLASARFETSEHPVFVPQPDEGTLSDTLRWTNLEPGLTYRLECRAFDYETLAPVQAEDGSPVLLCADLRVAHACGNAQVKLPWQALCSGSNGVLVRYALSRAGTEVASSCDLSCRKGGVHMFRVTPTGEIEMRNASGSLLQATLAVSYSHLQPTRDYVFEATVLEREVSTANRAAHNVEETGHKSIVMDAAASLARGSICARSSTDSGIVQVPLETKARLEAGRKYTVCVTCELVDPNSETMTRIYAKTYEATVG